MCKLYDHCTYKHMLSREQRSTRHTCCEVCVCARTRMLMPARPPAHRPLLLPPPRGRSCVRAQVCVLRVHAVSHQLLNKRQGHHDFEKKRVPPVNDYAAQLYTLHGGTCANSRSPDPTAFKLSLCFKELGHRFTSPSSCSIVEAPSQ